MSKFFKLSLALISILSLSTISPDAHAQQYQGEYAPQQKKYKDKAAPPVPRVFSSQVTSAQEAQKLDIIYNELYVSLWNYAITDFNYQKIFYSLVQPQKFETTRYSKEFSGVLKNAIENLNQNHKNMIDDVNAANEKYIEIKEGIRQIDYETLDPLWEEKISEFKAHAKRYFTMQHKYLKAYKSLVEFIIEQGGSYYYVQNERSVKFYDFSGYKYFGQSIDRLRKITFEQKKMLREKIPANVDVVSIQ